MLDPESMVMEQIIDKYIALLNDIMEKTDTAVDDDMLKQLNGFLQIGKITFLMTEALKTTAKQFNILHMACTCPADHSEASHCSNDCWCKE